MKVVKWGDSLAVCLPVFIVEALHLREGDDIEISVVCKRVLPVSSEQNRLRALDQLRKVQKPLPEGWRFDREDANAR